VVISGTSEVRGSLELACYRRSNIERRNIGATATLCVVSKMEFIDHHKFWWNWLERTVTA
jgi:hypothetical protein